MQASLDHLVVAGTDLSALVAWWKAQSGVAPAAGGAHVGRGSRNALVGLSPSAFLELIGPDPEQPDHPGPLPFGISSFQPNTIQLVTFALTVADLEEATAAVKSVGIDPGPIHPMQRIRPDGVTLSWRLAVPPQPELGGTMPFLIQWGSGTPHPASSLNEDCSVDSISVAHPQPAPIQDALDRLGFELTVEQAATPSVAASLNTPNGLVNL